MKSKKTSKKTSASSASASGSAPISLEQITDFLTRVNQQLRQGDNATPPFPKLDRDPREWLKTAELLPVINWLMKYVVQPMIDSGIYSPTANQKIPVPPIKLFEDLVRQGYKHQQANQTVQKLSQMFSLAQSI